MQRLFFQNLIFFSSRNRKGRSSTRLRSMAARSAPRELHLEGERGGGLCVCACGGGVGGGACGPLASAGVAGVAGWCAPDSRNDVSRGGGERAQDSTDRGGGGGGGGDSQGLADNAHAGTFAIIKASTFVLVKQVLLYLQSK